MGTGLQIKDVAAATGFTTATLRYYEQIGLLPKATRTASGYRTYDRRTIARLAFIARAKQLGCTLEEITGLTTAWEGGRCGPVQDRLRELVASKITATQNQLGELAMFTRDLQHAAAALERHRPDGCCDSECGCLSDPNVAPATVAATNAVSLPGKPAGASKEAAVACTLSAGATKGRLAEWQALLMYVDRREQLDGGVRCVFASLVPSDELMRLVAVEQDCCRFFRFAITIDDRGVALEVRAPADARRIVESLFGLPT